MYVAYVCVYIYIYRERETYREMYTYNTYIIISCKKEAPSTCPRKRKERNGKEENTIKHQKYLKKKRNGKETNETKTRRGRKQSSK